MIKSNSSLVKRFLNSLLVFKFRFFLFFSLFKGFQPNLFLLFFQYTIIRLKKGDFFMREIRKLGLEDIEAYTKIAYLAYPSFKDFSDPGIEEYQAGIEDSLKNDKNVHFYGMFQENKLLGVMRLFDFEMNYHNKMVKSSGLGYLGVDILHKKEKIALEMVKFYEELYKSKGTYITSLLAFRPDFYKPMGYGIGTKMNQYRIASEFIPNFDLASDLRLVETREDFEKVFACHKEIVQSTHGMIMKIYDEKRDLREDNNIQVIASYDRENKVEGYLAIEFENTKADNLFQNNIYVLELKYKTPLVLKKLLSFLSRQKDEIQTVIFNTKDENFHYLFSNPLNDTNNYIRYGNIESNTQAVGMMYKVVDVYKAFEDTSHRRYNDLTLGVRFVLVDDYDSSKKEYIVNFKDGYVDLANKGYDVSLELKLSDFSSLFMGAVSLKGLYNLGLLEISDLKFLNPLDLGFYSDKPKCNIDF